MKFGTVILLGLASVAQAYATEHPGCSLVYPVERVASSAAGKWYLVSSIIVKQKPQEKSLSAECGGFNNLPPCSCSFFEISSNLPAPYIEKYNITAYGFNTLSQEHGIQDFQMILADQVLAIFNVIPREGDHYTVRGLATDDHMTYMVLDVCSQKIPADEYIWIVSKTPKLLPTSMSQVHQTLEKNNLSSLKLNPVYQGADVCMMNEHKS